MNTIIGEVPDTIAIEIATSVCYTVVNEPAGKEYHFTVYRFRNFKREIVYTSSPLTWNWNDCWWKAREFVNDCENWFDNNKAS